MFIANILRNKQLYHFSTLWTVQINNTNMQINVQNVSPSYFKISRQKNAQKGKYIQHDNFRKVSIPFVTNKTIKYFAIN